MLPSKRLLRFDDSLRYGYPIDAATRVALDVTRKFLESEDGSKVRVVIAKSRLRIDTLFSSSTRSSSPFSDWSTFSRTSLSLPTTSLLSLPRRRKRRKNQRTLSPPDFVLWTSFVVNCNRSRLAPHSPPPALLSEVKPN